MPQVSGRALSEQLRRAVSSSERMASEAHEAAATDRAGQAGGLPIGPDGQLEQPPPQVPAPAGTNDLAAEPGQGVE